MKARGESRLSQALSILALAAVWAATAGPLLTSGTRLGVWDWDHHLASAEIERQAVLEHGVLPLWNPYIHGGLPVLQHPQSTVLCPDFALVLLLGVPIGFKVMLAFRLALGLLGGVLLGRSLGLPAPVAAFLSIAMNAGGAYAAHVALGHAEWSLLGYVPWILLALLRGQDRGSAVWGVAAGAGIALLYLGGNLYLLFGLGFLSVSFGLVESIRGRSPAPLVRSLLPFVLAGVLSGVKLLPSAELFADQPRRPVPFKALFEPDPAAGWWELPKAAGYVFLRREIEWPDEPSYLRHDPLLPQTPDHFLARSRLADFVNFSAYFGLLPLLFVPLAFVSRDRRVVGLALGTGLLLILVFSSSLDRVTGLDPWQWLRALPVLGSLRTSGRFLAIAVCGLAVLSALGLAEVMRRWPARARVPAGALAIAMLLATSTDLSLRNADLLARALPYPKPALEKAGEFVTHLRPRRGFDLVSVQERVGALSGHSNLSVRTGALPVGYRGYRGEAFLDGGAGTARLVSIHPNAIEVEVSAETADTLIVNQTFLAGWVRSDRDATVFSRDARLATEVRPGNRLVRLEYRSRLLIPGAILSATGVLGAAVILAQQLRRRRRRAGTPGVR